ncbi:MAG: hypothetical protein MUF09_01490 [Candidatus Nanopelagicales bacterium]|nr:hypothetical protein [Candidatus Nanopelagicales bacterium]
MDGGTGRPVTWRSSIPGVSQCDGAPASLGLAGRGVRAALPGDQGPARSGEVGEPGAGAGSSSGRTGDARTRRRGWRRPIPGRTVGLAVAALVAITGVAWAAGEGDAGAGALGPQWVVSASPAPLDVGLDAPVVPAPDASLRPGATPEPLPIAPPPPVVPPRASATLAGQDGTPAPVVDPADPTPDWWAVLAELDRRRVRALVAVDPALLSTYADPESSAWRQDSALIAELAASGLRPEGLESALVAIERVEAGGDHARVRIVDRRGAYSLVDAEGAVVQQVERAGLTRWVVTLRNVGPSPAPDAGWRVAEVVALPTSGGGP